eukprot:365364-Chlamydomonas_euryale.AAC.1
MAAALQSRFCLRVRGTVTGEGGARTPPAAKQMVRSCHVFSRTRPLPPRPAPHTCTASRQLRVSGAICCALTKRPPPLVGAIITERSASIGVHSMCTAASSTSSELRGATWGQAKGRQGGRGMGVSGR